MAQPQPKTKKPVENVASLSKKLKSLSKRVEQLEAKRTYAPHSDDSKKVNKRDKGAEQNSGLRMTDYDKVVNIANILAILNPKLEVDGRHTIENVQAVAGYPVGEKFG